MEQHDIRWRQRLVDELHALAWLEESLRIDHPDIVHQAGIIHFFEMSLELAWNTMKDFMEEQGVTDIAWPRSVVKKAFAAGLIFDGHLWLEALESRNLTAHAYDEKSARQIEIRIRQEFFPMLKRVHASLLRSAS